MKRHLTLVTMFATGSVICAVLAAPMGVADAAVHYEDNYPTDLILNAANPQSWSGGDEVRIGTANKVNGAGVWDSTLIVESTGVVTSERLWVGMGSTGTSGKLIVDGGYWNATKPLHLATRGPDGLGTDEVNLVEVKNGGSLGVQGLEIGQHDGAFGRLIVDNATLTNPGGARLGTGSASNSSGAEVTIRNGGSGGGGFTHMSLGTGHSTLNVDGAGSLWNGHSFMMGSDTRSADLSITGGGQVHADNFLCATGSLLCDVTISGPGSELRSGYDVDLGQAGPALITIDEGGLFNHTDVPNNLGVDVGATATLIFGVGNGAMLVSLGDVTIADGATIGVKLDSGFTPTDGVPIDLVTTTETLTVTAANLVFDQSQLPAGLMASLSATDSALQVTFLPPVVPEPSTLMLLATGGVLAMGRGRRGG